jgi:hypothetical protein
MKGPEEAKDAVVKNIVALPFGSDGVSAITAPRSISQAIFMPAFPRL